MINIKVPVEQVRELKDQQIVEIFSSHLIFSMDSITYVADMIVIEKEKDEEEFDETNKLPLYCRSIIYKEFITVLDLMYTRSNNCYQLEICTTGNDLGRVYVFFHERKEAVNIQKMIDSWRRLTTPEEIAQFNSTYKK